VPFYIRAGKCLPVTCTELLIRRCRPPKVFPGAVVEPNHFRFRISPDVTLALGMMSKSVGDDMHGQSTEMVATLNSDVVDMDAYERVLRDAMAGDATLFAREDYVEEAWRIVDPVIKANTPVYTYEPGTWGPAEVEEKIVPEDGWHNPVTGNEPAVLPQTRVA